MNFDVHAVDGAARCGTLTFRRGTVKTPALMPVGTYGTIKSVTPEEVSSDGTEIILGHTFHLMLRPGTAVIRKHGGLAVFMNSHSSLLSVSGGFLVFLPVDLRKCS